MILPLDLHAVSEGKMHTTCDVRVHGEYTLSCITIRYSSSDKSDNKEMFEAKYFTVVLNTFDLQGILFLWHTSCFID